MNGFCCLSVFVFYILLLLFCLHYKNKELIGEVGLRDESCSSFPLFSNSFLGKINKIKTLYYNLKEDANFTCTQ